MKDLQTKLHKGYYYDAFKTKYDKDGLMYEVNQGPLKNTMKQNPLENSFRFKKDYFNDYFYDNFWSYFLNQTNEIIDITFNYSITLDAPSGHWFEIMENSFEGVNLTLLNNKKQLKISVSDFAREQIELQDFINNLKTRGRWTSHLVSNWCVLWNDRRQWHDFEFYRSGKEKGREREKIKIALETNDDKCGAGGYNDTNPENIKIDESEINEDNYKLKFENNVFINKLDVLFKINELESTDFKGKNIFNKQLGKDIQGTLKELSSLKNSQNYKEYYKKVLFSILFDKLKQNLYNTDISNSPIFDDLMYGSTLDNKETKYQYSFHESQLKFQSQILKPIENKNENLTLNIGDVEFTTTFKNWKENFYFLENDKNNNGIRIQRMYYVDNNKSKDFSKYSDQLKENMASNPNAAKEIMFQNYLQILRKGYEIYDINGKMFFSRKNESEVITELKKQIELSYKYIHKNESINLKDQEKDWENLISDGRYTIFKFKLNTGKWVYYKDYQSALEIYKNQSSLINSISEEFIIYKIYSTMINNKLVNYEWSSKINTRILAEKIYNDSIVGRK
ncbi:hypothetical protein [Spiroplasma endosymbiont of Atherix ibis]|uniref:hypothetical protein n=1 Tax=Spiroplasma endosymbiont of Atherix ibis TaxID=3066291 RepID=UPI0030D30B7D